MSDLTCAGYVSTGGQIKSSKLSQTEYLRFEEKKYLKKYNEKFN